MSGVFVDTVAWIALLNVNDALYEQARQVMETLRHQNARLITTEFVLLEVADALSTPSIRSLIRDNKTFRITSDIQTGAKYGMITLDAHLMALYRAGQIRYEDLITKSQDPELVLQKLREDGKKKKR